jgi:hypothetical protein
MATDKDPTPRALAKAQMRNEQRKLHRELRLDIAARILAANYPDMATADVDGTGRRLEKILRVADALIEANLRVPTPFDKQGTQAQENGNG